MRKRDHSDVPSPLLSLEQVNERLVGLLGELGAAGGAIGGSLKGWPPATAAGASGGRIGGRFGARHFTKLDGAQQTFPVERTEAGVQAVRTEFFTLGVQEQFGQAPGSAEDAVMMVGMVGSGALSMNPCVIQVVWFAGQLHAFAHAREGWIKQRTCVRALQRLEELCSC